MCVLARYPRPPNQCRRHVKELIPVRFGARGYSVTASHNDRSERATESVRTTMGHKNKHLCPCGSGKRIKICCKRIAQLTKPGLTQARKLELRRAVEKLDRAGKHVEACEILLQLLAVSPRNPLIWNDLGVQYGAAGELERALDALRRGYLCDSTFPPILYNLGKFTFDRMMLLHTSGDLSTSEAQEMLRNAVAFLDTNLDRDPQNADAHHYLALAYAFAQNERRARAHREVALRMKKELEPPKGLGG